MNARTLLFGLQGVMLGLGIVAHLGYYLTKAVDSPPTALAVGWACYIASFLFLALRALTDPSRRGDVPHS